MNNKFLISIIIPTFNSAQYLENCLRAILRQTYHRYEVIIVDQKSTDGTPAIAKKYKAQIIFTQKPKFYSPPSKSRNIGAKKAKGDILYHLDSDMQMNEKLLEEAVSILSKNPRIGALIVHEDDKTKGFFSKCKSLERQCYRGNDTIDSARIVRKEIFEKVKGYDESISSGEDFSIQEEYKKYCNVAYCHNTVIHDLTQLNFLKLIQKKYNYGKTAATYFNKSTRTPADILMEEGKSYIKSYKLLARHPVLTLGMIFMRFCEIGAGGFSYITNKT